MADQEKMEMTLAELDQQEIVSTFGPGFDLMADLTRTNRAYCSFEAEDDKARAMLFNVTNQTPENVADHLGEEIELTDIYIEMIDLEKTDDFTGEVKRQSVPRIVLIAKDGTGYGCVSVGVYKAVKTLFRYFGQPGEWNKPRRIKFKQLNLGERRLLTFEVLG